MTDRISPYPPGGLADLPANVWLIGQESPASQRCGRYVLDSVRGHSGKMLPQLARRLVEAYTRPGHWILDPLSGIGTVGVEAVESGRHYVGIELEPRFVAWQHENLQRAAECGAPGRFVVHQGDARRLNAGWPGGCHRRRPAQPLDAPAVDAVITSPPYDVHLDLRSADRQSAYVRQLIPAGKGGGSVVPGRYGLGSDNIGNLRRAAYWEAMRQVYTGCAAVLKPGGLLVLALRSGREQQRLRPLHHDTARLCQELGLDFLDEVVAILSRVQVQPGGATQFVTHGHLWRRLTLARLRDRGWPITLNQLEYVLVFRKPPQARPGTAPTDPDSVSLLWPSRRGANRAGAPAR